MAQKRKPQVVWMPTSDSGYLWYQHAGYTRREAVKSWCEATHRSWAEWRKVRPSLTVVKVELRPVSP